MQVNEGATSGNDKGKIVPTPKRELVLEGDPEQQLRYATKAANALMRVVKPRKIGGKDYLEYGGWQILGRFFGSTAAVESTKRLLNDKGEFWGYEARAQVLQHGNIISSAEAVCLNTERNWKTRDEFALKSMAQTRACSKALRNAYGWVAELAGLASTPAEEMGYDVTPIADNAPIEVVGTDNDIPESVSDQRKRIFALLKQRGVDVTDGKACKAYVADNTQLELVESNYPSIIKALDK